MKLRTTTSIAALGFLSACSTYAPTAGTSEGQGPNGNYTYRTPMMNQATDCTVTTQENGQVVQGQWVVFDQGGQATRRCVSGPSRGDRQQILMQRTGERAASTFANTIIRESNRALGRAIRNGYNLTSNSNASIDIPLGFNTFGAGAALMDDPLLQLAKMGVVEVTANHFAINVPKGFKFPENGKALDLNEVVDAWKKAPKNEITELLVQIHVAGAIAERNKPAMMPK